jgi:hypothetical protein
MEALIDHLPQFGCLNRQQIDLEKSNGVLKELKKEEYYADYSYFNAFTALAVAAR